MRITESQLRRIIRQEVRSLTEMPARRPAAPMPMATPMGEVSYSGPEFQVVGATGGTDAMLGDGPVEMNALEFDRLASFCSKQRRRCELDPVSFVSINAFPNGFEGAQGEGMSFEASADPRAQAQNFRDAAAFLRSMPGASFEIYASN